MCLKPSMIDGLYSMLNPSINDGLSWKTGYKIWQGLYVSQPTYKANNNIIRQLGCYIRIFIQLYGGWLVDMKIYLSIQQPGRYIRISYM